MTDCGEVFVLLLLLIRFLRLKTNILLRRKCRERSFRRILRRERCIQLLIVVFRTTPSSSLWTLAWPHTLTSARVISAVHPLAIANARILNLQLVVVPDARRAFDRVKRGFHPHNYFETGLNPHSIHIAKWIEIKPVWNRFRSIHFQCECDQSGLNRFECALIRFHCAVWTRL